MLNKGEILKPTHTLLNNGEGIKHTPTHMTPDLDF